MKNADAFTLVATKFPELLTTADCNRVYPLQTAVIYCKDEHAPSIMSHFVKNQVDMNVKKSPKKKPIIISITSSKSSFTYYLLKNGSNISINEFVSLALFAIKRSDVIFC